MSSIPSPSAVDFYALALLRDAELLKHAMELREMDRQKTSVMVIGGFHCAGITRRLRAEGFSYAVVTPQVKRMGAVDEDLYIERMLGRHLTAGDVLNDTHRPAIALWEPPLNPNLPTLWKALFHRPGMREAAPLMHPIWGGALRRSRTCA